MLSLSHPCPVSLSLPAGRCPAAVCPVCSCWRTGHPSWWLGQCNQEIVGWQWHTELLCKVAGVSTQRLCSLVSAILDVVLCCDPTRLSSTSLCLCFIKVLSSSCVSASFDLWYAMFCLLNSNSVCHYHYPYILSSTCTPINMLPNSVQQCRRIGNLIATRQISWLVSIVVPSISDAIFLALWRIWCCSPFSVYHTCSAVRNLYLTYRKL